MAHSSSLDHEELRAECQRYLTSFRVLELKELLKQCGQSTKGRKSDLFQRANDMLQFGSPKIQTKIREIYDKSNSRRQLSYGRAAHKISSPVKSEESVIKSTSRAHIVHPDVKFKTLPFFSKLETIVRPTALVSSGVSGHSSMSMKVKFHLTPQQIHQIYISKTSTGTYQTQILVRFCLQETTCDQNDYYPKQCYVKVNGHSCPIPGYHPHLSTRPEYKRNGQPVNITNFVKTSPTEMNEVTVFWAPDFMLPQGYCVGIEISKVVSSSDLLQGLKAKGVRSSDMSRALVKEKFTVDKDSEVAATSMKVSLLCPIGKMRMSYPCRTTSCTHLQCFDASIFYQMNEKRARWVCPVCDKPALPEDLFIDGLFMEICQNSPSSDTIIEFMGDGSWRPSTEISGTCLNVDTPEKRGSSPISLDSSDGGKKKSDIVVIDLTGSSDEEDNGGTTQVDGEEEEDEEEGEEEERQESRRNTSNQRDVHSLTTERRRSEDADSDTGPSSNSSATVSASSPPPTLSLKPSTFPRLSVVLHSDHAPSSPPLTTTPSHSFTISLPTPSRASRRISLTSPTSSARLRLSSSSTLSPADSQATTPTAASSSRPTSVIIEGRPHPSSNNNQDSWSHSHSSPRSHSQSVFRLHSRSRKHSHSSPHPYSSSSSSHPHHHHKRHHSTHSRASTTRHSKNSTSHSSSATGSPDTSSTSGAPTEVPGSGSTSNSSGGGRGGGQSVLSQGLGGHQLAPYFPLHPNGIPTPGDTLLASNIFSIDENIMNMLRAGLFPMASVQTRNHKDTED